MKSIEEIFSTINYYLGRTIYYIYFGGLILYILGFSIYHLGTPEGIMGSFFALMVYLLAWALYKPILKFNIWSSTKIYGIKPSSHNHGRSS